MIFWNGAVNDSTPNFDYWNNGEPNNANNEDYAHSLYNASVRSKKMCGMDDQKFVVLTIPNFFTPNNDGVNETFFVKGMIYYPKASLKIFDRFGKIVGVINASKTSWERNYKGLNLPSTDYWYIIYVNDKLPEIRSPFAMKR